MKQQTAVEWLEQSLTKYFNKKMKDSIFKINNCFENAKQVEKKQIIEAWLSGENDGSCEPKMFVEMAEEYYNETYKF